jgi:RNA polymerase sigma factor (TIGR02999 family)
MDPLDVTNILAEAERGDPDAARQLLPLVYEELRRLAAQKVAGERVGHTLQATALVHEAYMRLVGGAPGERPAQRWENRRHFFGAAAEAMRRILVEAARRRESQKRGGGRIRHDLDAVEIAAPQPDEDVLALDEALARLSEQDPAAAEVVKLRYFAGLTLPECAQVLAISPRTADRLWAYAKAWLLDQLTAGG